MCVIRRLSDVAHSLRDGLRLFSFLRTTKSSVSITSVLRVYVCVKRRYA